MKDKFKSRKFWVIMGWNALVPLALISDAFFGTIGHFSEVLPWAGGMTTVWIAAQSAIEGKKKV